jgi:hypothetical protein
MICLSVDSEHGEKWFPTTDGLQKSWVARTVQAKLKVEKMKVLQSSLLNSFLGLPKKKRKKHNENSWKKCFQK